LGQRRWHAPAINYTEHLAFRSLEWFPRPVLDEAIAMAVIIRLGADFVGFEVFIEHELTA